MSIRESTHRAMLKLLALLASNQNSRLLQGLAIFCADEWRCLMKKWIKQFMEGSVVGSAAAAITAYVKLLRPRHLVWGSTAEEIRRPLPMDDMVTAPTYVTTRAITIHASPEQI